MLNEIHFGDCRASLRRMAAEGIQVQTCVTSPPYFGLRDYGHAGQIGLEETPEQFIAELVEVFRCVRDVLADDGTLWVNIGDSYNAHPGQRKDTDKAGGKQQTVRGSTAAPSRSVEGIKAKDLIGIPWMLAFALRADGWYLRQDIIWHKPNPMPESVTDRCTKAHEYVFLLSKGPRYFYDAEAVKEPAVSTKSAGNKAHKGATAYAEQDGEFHRTKAGLVALAGVEWETRNKRSVWSIATKPYKGAHFAVFPSALVEPCILAGTSERGHCPVCKARWVRSTSRSLMPSTARAQGRRAIELFNEKGLTGAHVLAIRSVGMADAGKAVSTMDGAGKNSEETQRLADEAKAALGGYFREFTFGANETTGWAPTCTCGVEPTPDVVLDPFMGSGTTAAVAIEHGRQFIGCELNETYKPLQDDRIASASTGGML